MTTNEDLTIGPMTLTAKGLARIAAKTGESEDSVRATAARRGVEVTTTKKPRRPAVTVRLTDAEAVVVLVALELHAQELEEGAGMKDAANARAFRKIEAARRAAASLDADQ